MDESLTKRGLESVCKAKKCARGSTESATSKGGGLGVFIASLEKLAVAILDIPDTSGMTCTAPTVTELKYARCQNSQRFLGLPTAETPDQLKLELLTLSSFEN